MTIAIYVGIGLLVVIALFLIAAATRPTNFSYERTAQIDAAPIVVHGLINDFRKWVQWSPWEDIDPKLQRTYEGPPTGVGSTYSWKGDKNVGSGKMTILDSRPGELIEIHLEFTAPMPGVCPTTFVIVPSGDGSVVTWRMRGQNAFMAKVFSLFINMDTMIGGNFEKGLKNLNAVARTASVTP